MMEIANSKLFKKDSLVVSDVVVIILTALMSVVFLAASISYASSPVDLENPLNTLTLRHADFDFSIYEGIEEDINDIDVLKESISSGLGIYAPHVIRDIILYHMDPVFILGLSTGSSNITLILFVAYYCKYALISAFCYLFLRRGIRLNQLPSCVLSVCFAVSSIVLTVSLNTALLNMVVIFPLALLFLITYGEKAGLKNIVYSVVFGFLLGLTGCYGVIIGLPFLLIISLLMIIGVKKAQLSVYLRVIFSWFISVLMSAVVVLPVFLSGNIKNNIVTSITTGEVRFGLFDSLFSFMDSTIVGGLLEQRFPVVGVSIFVVTLVILFFANKAIPYRFKIISGIFILLIYISVAYQGIDRLFLYEGAQNSFAYGRIALMTLYLIVLAAISLRNISSLTKGQIYMSSMAIIGYAIISNSSGNSITHGTVSLYLSAFMAIIACFLYSSLKENRHGLAFFLMLVILSGIAFKTAFALAPSSFPVDDLSKTTYADFGENESPDFLFEENQDAYFIASSDLSESIISESPSDQINMLSRAMLLNNIFSPCDSYPVYFSGVVELGSEMYEIISGNQPQIVNIRIVKESKDDTCYLSSSYKGHCTLRVLHDDVEDYYQFDGPFLYKFETDDISFVAACEFSGEGSGTFNLSALKMDVSEYERFISKTHLISSNEINLIDESSALYHGVKTIITSVRYDESYEVTYNRNSQKVKAECFNFNGHLAFNVDFGGVTINKATINCYSDDLFIGSIITIITLLSFIFTTFMYNKKTCLTENGIKADLNSNERETHLD